MSYFLRTFLFSTLCCGALFLKVQGQELASWQLTDEDGLPSMTVYDLLQDDEGFIWMGTENGLCKYDGRSFKIFSNELLKDNEILRIRKDAWNRIWFINLLGQLAYMKGDQVIPFPMDSILMGKQILNIQIGETIIWLMYKEIVSHKTGLLNYHLYREEEPVFNKQFSSRGVGSSSFRNKGDTLCTIERIADSLLILGHYTATKWSRKTIKHETIFKNSIYKHPHCRFQNYTLAVIVNEKGFERIIAIADDHLIELVTFEKQIKISNLKIIDSICWITSTEGVWNFPLGPKLQSTIPRKILKDINATDINKDREGNYWITTISQGVKVIPSLEMYLLHTGEGNLPTNDVYRLFYDAEQDQIISGHGDGKIAIHRANQMTQVLDLKVSGRVLDITQNHRRDFYFSLDGGLAVLDQGLNFQSKELGFIGAKIIMEDSRHRNWLGVWGNIFYSDAGSGLSKSCFKNVMHKRTYAIKEDAFQTIWLGTVQGIYYFKDSLAPYLENNIHEEYYVTSIKETSDSTLWVSTKTNGILAIKNQQTIHRFTTENGLASNHCKRVFWDGALLWIATNKGINYLDPKTREIGWINKKDGLPSNDVYDVLLAKNEVWVATPKGLVHFPKTIIHRNQTPPPVYLTALKVLEEEQPLTTSVQLSHDQNSLQFNFIGLGFKAKNSISYKYKMDGIDQHWIYTNNPSVRYPAINPGDYHFEVYAINEDGVESREAASMTVAIGMAWWQYWWLRLLVVLLLIGGVFLFFQNRFRQKEAQRKIQNKISQLKQQALQAQMNPHFIFNVLGAVQKYLTVNKQEEAMLYLSSFSKLIRSIFDYSKKTEITIEEEIDFLKRYLDLEKMRFKDKIEVKFTIDPSLDEYLYYTTIPPLLLQPLVENAFKHGLFHKEENGQLLLRFSKEKEFFQFILEDNGVGRIKSQVINQNNGQYKSHDSSGIQTVEERLQLVNHGQKNQDRSALIIEDLYHRGKATGTRITVSIYCSNFN